MSYYTFTSSDLEKKLNEIQYGTEAARIIEKLEAEIVELRAKLEATEKKLPQATIENG